MKRIKFERAARLPKLLMILNQEKHGAIARWDINDEQREVLKAIVEHERVIVLKYRQGGVSTITLLALFCFAIANPGVPCAIVADTQEKAVGLLARLAGWCDQLGVQLGRRQAHSIEFRNAGPDGICTVIDALTAGSRAEGGESRVGRSKSYGFIHASELAFWMSDEAAWGGLTSTALPGARIVIESTASAADNLFRKLWSTRDDDGAWHRVFLPVENHAPYRRHPNDIDDATWALLQGEKFGFTRRDSAAWWWCRMRVDLAGDETRALREFPQLPAHCFSFAKGRWILKFVEAATEQVGAWDEKSKRFQGWTHYRDAGTEPVAFGVDVAAGDGGDSSAIVVLGMLTGTIVATWMSHSTSLPDFVEVIKDAGAKYNPTRVVIEYNGVGIGPYEALSQFSTLPVKKQVSGEEKHFRLQRLKLAIEQGVVPIGPELIAEAKASRIEPPTGPKGRPRYEGRDDCLNALSFARELYLEELPDRVDIDPVARIDPQTTVSMERLNRMLRTPKY